MDSETDALEVESEVFEDTSLSGWASLLASQHPDHDVNILNPEPSSDSNAESDFGLGLGYPDDQDSFTEPTVRQSALYVSLTNFMNLTIVLPCLAEMSQSMTRLPYHKRPSNRYCN